MKKAWLFSLIVIFKAIIFILLILHNFYLSGKMNYKPAKSGEKREELNDWMGMQRISLSRIFNYNYYLGALQQARASHYIPSRDFYRVPSGPYNIEECITDIAIHPSQPQVLCVGTAIGGIYKSVVSCLIVVINGWHINLHPKSGRVLNLRRFAF